MNVFENLARNSVTVLILTVSFNGVVSSGEAACLLHNVMPQETRFFSNAVVGVSYFKIEAAGITVSRVGGD